MKIKDLHSLGRPPHIVIYGAAGTGKTALAAQARNAYCMDFDAGLMTAVNLKDKFYNLRQNLEFDTYQDNDVMNPSAWIRAKTKVLEIQNQVFKKEWPYEALIVDSLSGLSRTVQTQIMKACGRPMQKPQLQDYGLMFSEIENILQVITTLPILVIICTHEYSLNVGDETYIKPRAIGRKLPAGIAPLFDEVWWSEIRRRGIRDVDYLISWKPTKYRETRTRSGHLVELKHNEVGLEGVLAEIGYKYPTNSH